MARILVIEDERNIARAVHDRLARDGHEVVFFQTGSEGLAYAHAHPVDLIILDLLMPEMDGFQVVGELRRTEDTRLIPVVILSVLTPEERPEKLVVDAWLTKPYKGADLLRAVEQTLEKHSGGRHGS